jgi:hypothetical protein
VPSPQDPLRIAKPGGGTLELNYRVEIPDIACDLPPTDVTVNNFPNPFGLTAQQLAVYLRLSCTIASRPPTTWLETLTIDSWIQCQLLPLADDVLSFEIRQLQVLVEDLASAPLINILNNVLNALLAGMIVELKFPLGGLATGTIFSIDITDITLASNAIDVHLEVVN